MKRGRGPLIDSLLHSEEPSIRWKVMVQVLGEDPHSAKIRALQEDIRRSPRAMLAGREHRLVREAKVYSKYRGAHWTLAPSPMSVFRPAMKLSSRCAIRSLTRSLCFTPPAASRRRRVLAATSFWWVEAGYSSRCVHSGRRASDRSRTSTSLGTAPGAKSCHPDQAPESTRRQSRERSSS
jgi:hypothetical protein